jgi:hypothetical protein
VRLRGAEKTNTNNVLNIQNVPAIISATVLRQAAKHSAIIVTGRDVAITLRGINNRGAVVMLLSF